MTNVGAQACSQGLNVSQRLAVSNAIAKLRLNEKLVDVSFWGKIQGKEHDYLIAQSVSVSTRIEKSRFFSHDNGVTFAKLPDLDSFIIEKAPLHSGRFSGNPSLKLRDPSKASDQEEEEELEEDFEEDGEEAKTRERKLTEMERLAYVVDQIETICAVVPRGAWHITATGDIKRNAAYAGVTLSDASKLDSYCLLRPPQHEHTLAKIHKAGVSNSVEFLDTLAMEEPSNSWSLQVSPSGQAAALRSLLWPGFEFRTEVGLGATSYSKAYFGTGERNADLAFMV